MSTNARSWAVDRPIDDSPFALPRGFTGRLAGRIMLWTNRQHEILEVLDVKPGDRVLEVGYGPGGLIRLLSRHTEAALIMGVDPSEEMQRFAERTNRVAVREGRVDVRLGTAESTGLPDECVDHVVSVNNVAIWADLDAGARELSRVLRPRGSLVIGWHGGRAPSRMARRLRLPDDKLDRIEQALREHFSEVTRHELTTLDVFKAIK
ncbi:MAG TPA: methyltransferase domain-containing protein [Actinopolymorphaceae bacterium]